jgi:FdhD protein
MRTPGNDFELAAGFLVTEGLAVAPDIAAIGYCDGVAPDRRWNTVTVFLRQPWDLGRARQGVVSASCGVCGKDSIEQVELACPPVAPVGQIKGSVVSALPELLRATQTAFDRTGGLHAAGLFTPSGGAVCSREDVGRHNAVDKVVGHLLLSRKAPPAGSALAVSGRVSFEIVQKAAVARLGLVVAVSAPSSLAVAAARRLGVTVVGFVRGGRFNVYSHPERLDLDG